jgi:hypothetical protein
MLAFPTASITSTPIPTGIGINCTKVQKLRSLISCFEDAAASMNVKLPYLVVYSDGADNLTYDTISLTWTPTKPAITLRDWEPRGSSGKRSPWCSAENSIKPVHEFVSEEGGGESVTDRYSNKRAHYLPWGSRNIRPLVFLNLIHILV